MSHVKGTEAFMIESDPDEPCARDAVQAHRNRPQSCTRDVQGARAPRCRWHRDRRLRRPSDLCPHSTNSGLSSRGRRL